MFFNFTKNWWCKVSFSYDQTQYYREKSCECIVNWSCQVFFNLFLLLLKFFDYYLFCSLCYYDNHSIRASFTVCYMMCLYYRVLCLVQRWQSGWDWWDTWLELLRLQRSHTGWVIISYPRSRTHSDSYGYQRWHTTARWDSSSSKTAAAPCPTKQWSVRQVSPPHTLIWVCLVHDFLKCQESSYHSGFCFRMRSFIKRLILTNSSNNVW